MVVQEAIDKGAFRQKGDSHAGAPNMVNIMRTAIEIAGAMTYLHSLDILHSDLNGNNILLISNTGIDDRPFSVKVGQTWHCITSPCLQTCSLFPGIGSPCWRQAFEWQPILNCVTGL